MSVKDIKELIKLIDEFKLSEFKLEDGDLKLTIRPNTYSKGGALPVQTLAPLPKALAATQVKSVQQSAIDEAGILDADLIEVKSPIVGTFFRSSAAGKPPFVKVGDLISEGDTVCIVEAMKLFNEIESEVTGKIVKVLVEDASPVEYDQVLFLVDPKG